MNKKYAFDEKDRLVEVQSQELKRKGNGNATPNLVEQVDAPDIQNKTIPKLIAETEKEIKFTNINWTERNIPSLNYKYGKRDGLREAQAIIEKAIDEEIEEWGDDPLIVSGEIHALNLLKKKLGIQETK